MTKTATVSLLGNRYEVDQALCGRRVELRFDPYDLELIEVYYAGRPFGHAVPHVIGRHVHPHAEEPDGQPRPVSGIDYLRLIEQPSTSVTGSRAGSTTTNSTTPTTISDGDGDDTTMTTTYDDDAAAAAAAR